MPRSALSASQARSAAISILILRIVLQGTTALEVCLQNGVDQHALLGTSVPHLVQLVITVSLEVKLLQSVLQAITRRIWVNRHVINVLQVSTVSIVEHPLQLLVPPESTVLRAQLSLQSASLANILRLQTNAPRAREALTAGLIK